MEFPSQQIICLSFPSSSWPDLQNFAVTVIQWTVKRIPIFSDVMLRCWASGSWHLRKCSTFNLQEEEGNMFFQNIRNYLPNDSGTSQKIWVLSHTTVTILKLTNNKWSHHMLIYLRTINLTLLPLYIIRTVHFCHGLINATTGHHRQSSLQMFVHTPHMFHVHTRQRLTTWRMSNWNYRLNYTHEDLTSATQYGDISWF